MTSKKTIGALVLASAIAIVGLNAGAQAAQDGPAIEMAGNMIIMRKEGSLTYFLHSSGTQVRYCELYEASRLDYTRLNCTGWK